MKLDLFKNSINKIEKPTTVKKAAKEVVEFCDTVFESDIKNIVNEHVPLNKSIVRSFEKLDKHAFIEQVISYVLKSKKIPDDCIPVVAKTSADNVSAMAYQLTHNKMFYSEGIDKASNQSLFGLVNHEIKHFFEVFNVLRTEDVGQDAVYKLAKRRANSAKEILTEMASSLTEAEVLEFKAQGDISEKQLKSIIELRELIKSKPSDVDSYVDKFYKAEYIEAYNFWDKFKKNAINSHGMIKKDSEDFLYNKEMLNSMLKANESISTFDYLASIHELSANKTQAINYIKYLYYRIISR